MNPYRIIIADDHSLIRQGLKSIIVRDPSLEIIAEAGDGRELLELLKEHPADLVILDISMPQLNGIAAVGKIRKLYPNMAILVLTMHANSQYFYQAITSGAHGYLMKDDSESELLLAITTIKEGHPYVSPQLSTEVTRDVITSFREPEKSPFVVLSAREKQVLGLVVKGYSSRKIAELLDLSPRTIDHHRANLLKKFKMKNTVDLVNYVVRNAVLLAEN